MTEAQMLANSVAKSFVKKANKRQNIGSEEHQKVASVNTPI